MRKLIILISILLLCCISTTSCGGLLCSLYTNVWQEPASDNEIDFHEDGNITYNGRKYLDIYDKIFLDYGSEHAVEIASGTSFTFNFKYYGDNAENPTFIADDYTSCWVREGVDLNDLIMNNECVISDSFSFKLRDVITDESIPFSESLAFRPSLAVFEEVHFKDYPAFYFFINIISINNSIYLQYSWDSNFYKITDEFKAELKANAFIDTPML